ncbi:MAG TPA: metallophosphoesterase [Candidatus Saccharimonadales bacterium]|nr:metallophosphoesterase [Candidatus Saccharimonadales bacterium]
MTPKETGGRYHSLYIILFIALCVALLASAVLAWYYAQDLTKSPVADSSVSNQSFTFAAAGDFDSAPAFVDVLKQIKASDANFTLGLGDLSYGNVIEREWCDKVHETLGATHAFELVFGNHDDVSGSKAGLMAACLPNRMPDMVGDYGSKYYFDYKGLARIIGITPDITLYGQTNQYDQGSEQYKWLSDRIDEAQKQQLWVVVSMHKNCLTIGVKDCEIGQDLFNMLLQKRVDIILQGHEHGYMRSKQLRVGEDCTSPTVGFKPNCLASDSNDLYNKGDGSVLVITGTGGVEPRDAQLDSPLAPYFASVHVKNANPVYGPTIFYVTPVAITAQLIDTAGNVQDSFRIER